MKDVRAFLVGSVLAIAGAASMTGSALAWQSPPELPNIPEIETRVALTYYDVRGTSERELNRSLSTTGPAGFTAQTDYQLEPRWQYEDRGSECVVTNIDLLVDILITYPRWVDEERAPRRMRQQWATRMARLEIHENGHAVLAFMGAVDVYNAMIAIRSAPDCETLNGRLREAHETAFRALRSEQLRYDRITEHGRIQEEFDWAPVFGG